MPRPTFFVLDRDDSTLTVTLRTTPPMEAPPAKLSRHVLKSTGNLPPPTTTITQYLHSLIHYTKPFAILAPLSTALFLQLPTMLLNDPQPPALAFLTLASATLAAILPRLSHPLLRLLAAPLPLLRTHSRLRLLTAPTVPSISLTLSHRTSTATLHPTAMLPPARTVPFRHLRAFRVAAAHITPHASTARPAPNAHFHGIEFVTLGEPLFAFRADARTCAGLAHKLNAFLAEAHARGYAPPPRALSVDDPHDGAATVVTSELQTVSAPPQDSTLRACNFRNGLFVSRCEPLPGAFGMFCALLELDRWLPTPRALWAAVSDTVRGRLGVVAVCESALMFVCGKGRALAGGVENACRGSIAWALLRSPLVWYFVAYLVWMLLRTESWRICNGVQRRRLFSAEWRRASAKCEMPDVARVEMVQAYAATLSTLREARMNGVELVSGKRFSLRFISASDDVMFSIERLTEGEALYLVHRLRESFPGRF